MQNTILVDKCNNKFSDDNESQPQSLKYLTVFDIWDIEERKLREVKDERLKNMRSCIRGSEERIR